MTDKMHIPLSILADVWDFWVKLEREDPIKGDRLENILHKLESDHIKAMEAKEQQLKGFGQVLRDKYDKIAVLEHRITGQNEILNEQETTIKQQAEEIEQLKKIINQLPSDIIEELTK